MKFEEVGLTDKVVDLENLDYIMTNLGFHRGEQCDFERVTYDRKFENLDSRDVFYLRVQGYALEGDVDSGHAEIKLLTPLLGKHYYPHGVEYGEDENFPKNVVNKSQDLLKKIKQEIEKL